MKRVLTVSLFLFAIMAFSFSAFAQSGSLESSSLLETGSAEVSGTTTYDPSDAPVVFLDQAPNQVNGLFSDSNCGLCATGAQVIADNFVVTTASPNLGITEVVMWGGYHPENIPNPTDDFTVILHSDNAGEPGADLYTFTALQPARATTGVTLFGVDEYMFTFDFSATPMMITSAGTYWIEIFNASTMVTNGFFWETGNLDGTNGIAGNAWITVAPGVPPWNLDPATDNAIQISGDDNIPVELTSFTASVNENDVTLNWVTATELNNLGFEIQRNSGNDYQAIGFIDGHGTTTQAQEYSFTDVVTPGSYSYRLKQVDLDGTFEYSNAIEVDVTAPDVFALEQNYPNPFNPSTKIDFSLAVDSKVSLRIFDVLGQEVATLISSDLVAGAHNVDFNASNFNSGVYFYRIEATGIDGTNFTNSKKMILTK